MYSKRIALFAALLTLLSARAFCEEKLVILSPHHEGIKFEFENGFGEDYRARTGRTVTVEWLDVGGTSDILRFIKSEFSNKPEGIDVDLFFGGGIDPFVELTELGLTQPYKIPDEILNKIARSIGGIPMYDADYNWYGATLAGFGIMYNKVVLDLMKFPEPKTWEDLGDPRLLSWVSSADPRNSGSVHMMYEIILQAYGWKKGWEVITRMGANVRNFVKGASQTPKDVAAGDVAYGLAIDFYALAMMDEAGPDKIGYVMPDGLTVVNPDGIAILKGAPQPDVAEAFIEFVLSEKGQRLWFYKKGVPGGPRKFQLNRLAITPYLYSQNEEYNSVKTNPFLWNSPFVYDSAKGSARWRVINDLIGVMIIDTKDQLVKAWDMVIRSGMDEEELERISAVPVTEEESLLLAGRWGDPEFRNETIADWTAFARRKYQVAEAQEPVLTISSVVIAAAVIMGLAVVVYLGLVTGRLVTGRTPITNHQSPITKSWGG